MQSKQKLTEEKKEERKEIYTKVRDAFAEKYGFLGAQASREMLMSLASWNIEKYSDPPFRFRNHIMLTWEPGWVKSTILMKMAKTLGDDMVSTCGKVTEAAIRGSVEGGRFTPPKPLKAPIVLSTEFGQTEFEGELLHTFLDLLEEGKTNVALNKIGQLSESERANIEERYGDRVQFKENNEFSFETDFVFWGATHEPELLEENALKSRFNVVTPAQPLTGEVTEALDKSPSIEEQLTKETVNSFRRMIKEDRKVETDFRPPSAFYTEYNITPRESRDLQSYMAARNWWGLRTDPEIMEDYVKQLKKSRRIASLSTKERVLELVFDNPLSYEEIQKETNLTEIEVYKILDAIDAKRAGTSADETKWVVRSGSGNLDLGDDDEKSDAEEFLEKLE